jgi:energy-coupling factor transport system permease protein
VPPTPTAYHRLNPLTKATAAIAVTIAALVVGGYLAPLVLLAAVLLPCAAAAGVLGRAIRRSLLVCAPIAVSVVLVSVLTRPGGTVLFVLGPFDATLEGVDFAARFVLRFFVMAMALTIFGLTTEPRVLLADLERRGVSPRLAFAAAVVLEAIPALLEHGREVAAAQRARGLDTEGTIGARLRGLTALVGPVVLSTLHGVEERSLALEARGFGRPGRRDLLWAPEDRLRERMARVLLLGALLALAVARSGGFLDGLP